MAAAAASSLLSGYWLTGWMGQALSAKAQKARIGSVRSPSVRTPARKLQK